MRLYLPCSAATLATLVNDGLLAGPIVACAVTPALRAWYAEGDDEDLEYSAQSRAADLSLGLIADDHPPRRIVLAVDARAEVDADVDPLVGARAVDAVVLADVAAILMDADDAVAAVRTALAALASSDADLPGEVEALDAHELAWFAPDELTALVERL